MELAKPYKEHERFLNAMILGSQDLTQGEGVHLLSIHASKGLEYEEVYVIDLMDGRFPNRKLMSRGGSLDRITSYNVCYTKLLRDCMDRYGISGASGSG